MVARVVADRDGLPLVLVPLVNSRRPAVLRKADYERLAALGYLRTPWRLRRQGSQAQQYVTAIDPQTQRPVTVARLVVEAKPTERVGYANGVRLHLYRENLLTTPITPRRACAESAAV